MTERRERYLGDGLYASFDGYQFKLRAPRLGEDSVVYLEPRVLAEFLIYTEEVTRKVTDETEP